jgi:protein involved in polysaccharide export with SLBB domain
MKTKPRLSSLPSWRPIQPQARRADPAACVELGTPPSRIFGCSIRSDGALACARILWMAAFVWLIGGSLVAREKPRFADVSAFFPEWTNAAPVTGTNSSPAPTLAATNASTALVTNTMHALDDKYSIAIGDRLSFRIIEDEEESPRPLIVADSGELEVPYIGRFPAVNKSCKKLARELKAELEKEYYYQATVILAVDQMSRGRGKVAVLGAVRIPGPQEIPRDEDLTVSKAIVHAGGFTDFADRRNVEVRRKSPTAGSDLIIKVDVKEILDKGNSAEDLTLQPDDIVYVPERLIRF